MRNCNNCLHNNFCNVDGYIDAEDCNFYKNKDDFIEVGELPRIIKNLKTENSKLKRKIRSLYKDIGKIASKTIFSKEKEAE